MGLYCRAALGPWVVTKWGIVLTGLTIRPAEGEDE